jgi:predicted NUDIX family NTP pyrophosphohydrolase
LDGGAVDRTSVPLFSRRGQYALEQHAREDQPEGPNSSADNFEHDWPQSSNRVQSRPSVRMHVECASLAARQKTLTDDRHPLTKPVQPAKDSHVWFAASIKEVQ